MGYYLYVRIFTIALGLVAVSWGAAAFPVFWRQSSIEHVAIRIIYGEPFKPEVLALQMSGARVAEERNVLPPGWSAQRRDYPITDGGAGDCRRQSVGDRGRPIQLASRRASLIGMQSRDSFLWLGLFWLTNTRGKGSILIISGT